MAFCQPCQTMKVHYKPVEPVNGFNKDMFGAKLLPTTVSVYPVDSMFQTDISQNNKFKSSLLDICAYNKLQGNFLTFNQCCHYILNNV